MADENIETGLEFDLPKNRSSVIKVIGVGGGGSNAVNHMQLMGIKGVDFMVCNTDAQALEYSPVKNRIQLGVTLNRRTWVPVPTPMLGARRQKKAAMKCLRC
jgi:cell division protein FtsZ